MLTDVATTAAAIKPALMRLKRVGVTQENPFAATQARMPVAPAPTVAAVAMHCAHMSASYRRRIARRYITTLERMDEPRAQRA